MGKQVYPKDLYLEPLLFLLYINDITDNLGNLARLFADDTSLSYSGKNFDLMQIEINNASSTDSSLKRMFNSGILVLFDIIRVLVLLGLKSTSHVFAH
jgi:hypothetical protein